MGRKKDLKELGQRGPGRKARKQKDPALPYTLKEAVKTDSVKKNAGGHIIQRSKKRGMKRAAQKLLKERREKRHLVKKAREEKDSDDKVEQEVDIKREFSDENKAWFQPVKKKRKTDSDESQSSKKLSRNLLNSDGSSDTDEGEIHVRIGQTSLMFRCRD